VTGCVAIECERTNKVNVVIVLGFEPKLSTLPKKAMRSLALYLWTLLVLAMGLCVRAVVIDEESDLPIKRLNAGMSMRIGIPLEEALERIKSMPHRRAALIRSLGATALTQRAGRNLIFRVLLTIGKLHISAH